VTSYFVNKAISRLTNLVSIGTCHPHVVCGSFKQALTVYGHDPEELALNLFYRSRVSSSREVGGHLSPVQKVLSNFIKVQAPKRINM